MPLHFEDRDIIPEVEGLRSALIVPCNMCPAVTVAARETKPFLQLFKSWLRSNPFEQHIMALQSRLEAHGVKTAVFKSIPYHQWFMCMWTSGKRKKLRKRAEQYDAVIVLGCRSATETVHEVVSSCDCKVIEGLELTGIMNAQLKLRWPGSVCFENCKIVPTFEEREKESKVK